MLATQTIEKNAELYKLLGNPKRLRILNLLAEEDLKLEELTRRLEADKANVSQHLSRLKAKGLLAVRREGRQAVYSLQHPEIVQACRILKHVQNKL